MSGLGEWDDEDDDTPLSDTTSATSATPAPMRTFGVDVDSLAAQLVDVAVKKAVMKHVGEVAAEEVEAALTDDVFATLRERAADQAAAAIAAQLEPEPEPEPIEIPPQLYYGNVNEFVREFLRHAYKREISGSSSPFWSGEWWKIDEALMRLEALWRSWEFLRLDPATGMSVWWRDHADHHMAKLMAADGPFGGSNDESRLHEPLPHIEPPEGLFRDEHEPAEEQAE